MIFTEIVVGLGAGFISGLFAAGGGMLVVPALMYIFKQDAVVSRATSIYAILPMVIVSGLFYFKNNYIDWKIGLECALGGIAGGYIGAKILKKMSDTLLRIIFVCFLIYVSIKMII